MAPDCCFLPILTLADCRAMFAARQAAPAPTPAADSADAARYALTLPDGAHAACDCDCDCLGLEEP